MVVQHFTSVVRRYQRDADAGLSADHDDRLAVLSVFEFADPELRFDERRTLGSDSVLVGVDRSEDVDSSRPQHPDVIRIVGIDVDRSRSDG